MTDTLQSSRKAAIPETPENPIRVMIVDDSSVVRGLISRMVSAEPDLAVVDSAVNGQQAQVRLAKNDADVVILDIEMPVEDGLTALPKLLAISPKVKVIMASTLTTANAEVSLRALRLGAVDYIPKPTTAHGLAAADDFKRELVAKIRALGSRRRPARRRPSTPSGPVAIAAPRAIPLRKPGLLPPRALAVGSSTGGPQALFTFFGALDKTIGIPVFVTQHMPPTFTTILAKHISEITGWNCSEATDGQPVESGRVYVAPGDRHMIVRGNGDRATITLTRDAPENFCRPSVDPMLRSLAGVYGGQVLTVILTGMGQDGLAGGKVVVDAGGSVIAQDQETSVVWGMPGAIATNGLCSAVLPLFSIAPHVNGMLGKAKR